MEDTTKTKFANNGLCFIASLWIETTIIIILCTSLASLVSQFIWGARLGLVVAILWAISRCKKEVFKSKLLSYKQGGWMLWTIIIGCFISLIVQPHCFLDSYSYRIPQMMFWIQEGHPWSVPNVDMRINQMPHVWPMLSASFYSFFGEKGIALPNFISLLLFIWLLKDSARNAEIKDQLVNYVVTIFVAAPVVVMGASTNDNVITCTTFLFLSYFFACRTDTTPKNIALSAISFALASGIKPQYLTLAPLWVGWFFLYEAKPYKQLMLIHYLYLIPLAIICSPIPTLAVNQFCYGSHYRPFIADVTTVVLNNPSGYSNNFIDSTIKLLKSHLDIPLNPFYKTLNSLLTNYGLQRFYFRPLIIPEWAGLGFASFIFFCIGICSAKKKIKTNTIIAIYSLVALTIAIAMTKAGSIGRSFIGFFWLMLPFALLGLSKLSKNVITAFTICSFLTGFFCIVFDPSAPLWPAKTVASKISSPKIKVQLDGYTHYSKRQYAASKIIDLIPDNENNLGIIIEGDTPIAGLWLNDRNKKKIIPMGLNISSDYLKNKKITYLLISHPKLINHDFYDFCKKNNLEEIEELKYTSKIQKGPEPWYLCKVKE